MNPHKLLTCLVLICVGLVVAPQATVAAGPQMDPNGLHATSDEGPQMDPDGLHATSEAGPRMDPDG